MPGILSRPLRIAVYNVENLFVLFDQLPMGDVRALSEDAWQRLSISTTPNKSLRNVLGVARAIDELDPDFVLLSEVGGPESLENFNRCFLGGRFKTFLIEGNSDRGIDLAFLARADLNFRYDLISHRNRPLGFLYPHERQSKSSGYVEIPSAKIESHRFSRDLLELRVYPDAQPQAAAEPVLILLAVHLKSQLDPERIDPGGRDRRRAELEKLVEIWREIESEFSGRVPVLIGGDFNGNAAKTATDPEFAALYEKTPLLDVLEIAQVPVEARTTFAQVYSGGRSRGRQLDYLFVPPSMATQVRPEETRVHQYRDETGRAIESPTTMDEKRLLPSDHYPVLATFEFDTAEFRRV